MMDPDPQSRIKENLSAEAGTEKQKQSGAGQRGF